MNDIKKFGWFNLFYLLIFVANLILLQWLTDYKVVSKPMIMASLIGFYISTVKEQSNVFIMAMIFALFGDIFLMFTGQDFFILGLGSFLIMQVLYAFTFKQDRITDIKNILYKAVPVFVLAVCIIAYLWDGLGALKIPVTVYALAISCMVITALIRKPSTPWYLPVVIGVTLFLISDALIAVSKFGNLAGNSIQYLIMSTYMIAQYLIVRGVIEKYAV